ncbi:acyl-CoA dehydrogenase family protein [Polaromonas sp. CG_23.6]|uniref:acyl-CoA dehydrogenase family protein n=1 Tax=Polaromonas sp. CG_23.6 TaxID=2760709 RepID=UPI002476BE23|nr:acyl-CoA dehydrogenase family protein [Polaromonas sp. CG_23.6]MDH6186958.1 alkylation response protein AidB-like acyl-CoA dehydrogenase [Polaromonas sp. CG_23.6]
MKDFLLNAEDKSFREEARGLLAAELLPRANAIEEREDWDSVKAAVRKVGQAGYLKLMFADLYSGLLKHPGLTHATILSEEAAAINYAFDTTIGTAISCAYPLHRHATPRVRERYLHGIVEGLEVGAIGVTEAGVGSDSAGMQTRIEFDESTNEWVINGFKRYISNASVADTYIVYGITSANVPAQKGMSALVVPRSAPGMSFPRNYHFMGRRGCIVGEVEFRDCRVPADHLLGERDGGFRIMLGMFNFERVILGGSALGVARSAFEIAVKHAQTRESFGQKLGCKQLIWDKIAEMSWRIDAAELLTYRAAKLYDAGTLSPKELMKPASQAKLVSTEAALYCADQTVQILGGDGLTKEYGRAEQIYRDARALTIVGGTSEMVKYLIASVDLPTLKPNL